jgi:hypothetical protein
MRVLAAAAAAHLHSNTHRKYQTIDCSLVSKKNEKKEERYVRTCCSLGLEVWTWLSQCERNPLNPRHWEGERSWKCVFLLQLLLRTCTGTRTGIVKRLIIHLCLKKNETRRIIKRLRAGGYPSVDLIITVLTETNPIPAQD